MPMSFSMYDSWTTEDRSNMIPVRESRRSEEHRRRRYSTSASSAVAKVHINVLPPAETKKEVHYVPTFIPTPVIQPTPAPPTYSIEATAEEIADRICAQNTAKNRLSSLEARLEEEHALRIAAEHERGREAARRETEQILADRRARELLEREENARRRVAEEYQYSRSLGNSPRTSGEDLWSTLAVTSTSTREGRLVVHDHRHSHSHSHGHRSHSDSRDRRCSRCGHSGHRSRECPGESIYVPTNRVRHITYLS